MKFSKAKTNLVLDITIGIAFLVEAVSGFVLWLALPQGGYRGGRNPYYGRTLILSRDAWLTLHDWFAVVMVIGILLHVILHWKWIVGMIRKV